MTDPRFLSIKIGKNKKYILDIQDARNRKLSGVTHYTGRRQLIVDLVKAFEAWDDAEGKDDGKRIG